MGKGLLPRLVQACTAECQASGGRVSGVCGKKAAWCCISLEMLRNSESGEGFPGARGALGWWGERLRVGRKPRRQRKTGLVRSYVEKWAG